MTTADSPPLAPGKPSLSTRIEVIVMNAVVAMLTLGFSFVLTGLWIFLTAAKARTHCKNKTLLVPGKKLQAGKPDHDFILRLNATLRLADDATEVILLGGAVDGSGISEATAGKKYLTEQTPAIVHKLRLEELSATTFENFRNVRSMLSEHTACAVLSNRYHLARCLSQARALGLSVTGLAAEPSLRLPIAAWLREIWFQHLFIVGYTWARLRRHRELLGYLD